MRSSNSFFKYLLKAGLFISFAASNLCFAQNGTSSAASSEASSEPTEKPIYNSVSERDNDLLVKAFGAIAKADEIQWLETPNEKIVSLFKAGEARKTKGALLIIHSPEAPQLWPALLENLRRNLPVYGWATFALPVPTRYAAQTPSREDSSASSTSTESSSSQSSVGASSATASSAPAKPILPRNQLIAERVEAATAQLNKNGQFNLVVLVDNSSAPDALAALFKTINATGGTSDTVDGPLQALILINMQDQEPLSKEQLDAIFSVAKLPVMDVFLNPDNAEQKDIRRKHHAEAMRKNLKDYQQLILLPQHQMTVDDKQSFWLGKVHGFLERKAEGNQIDPAVQSKIK